MDLSTFETLIRRRNFEDLGFRCKRIYLDEHMVAGTLISLNIAEFFGQKVEIRVSQSKQGWVRTAVIRGRDNFSIENFLRRTGRKDVADALERKPDETDEMCLERNLDFFIDLLKGELADVVRGERFPDVPYDWGLYK